MLCNKENKGAFSTGMQIYARDFKITGFGAYMGRYGRGRGRMVGRNTVTMVEMGCTLSNGPFPRS